MATAAPNHYFYLHQSTYQEQLADHLLNKLADEAKDDPFTCSQVLVRNQGMATWLRQRIADQQGIAMQIDFPQPNRFLSENLARVIQPTSASRSSSITAQADNPSDASAMIWPIYKQLNNLIDHSDFTPVKSYLHATNDALPGFPSSSTMAIKRYQLACQLATLFDNYMLYRPRWIKHWLANQPALAPSRDNHNEAWQRLLWRSIQANHTPHWSQHLLAQQTAKPPIDSPPNDTSMPSALHVFGISNFAPIYVHFLHLLSAHLPVHIYWMNPVNGYWEDAPTARQWVLAKAFDDPEILTQHNPLLASLGRMGREFIHTLYGGQEAEYEVQEEDLLASNPPYQPTTPLTRLQALQQAIHHNLPEPPTNLDQSPDLSISIHSCHSPLRELETLHRHLLTLAETEPLDNGEILILCPDIGAYAPLIEAVFGSTQSPVPSGDGSPSFRPTPEAQAPTQRPRLSYQIADRSATASDPLLSSLTSLLGLQRSRFTSRQAMDLLNLPSIHQRFGLSADDLATLRHWIAQTGIRWGFDDAHVASLSPTFADPPWTWRKGIERLTLGLAMPSPQPSFPTEWQSTFAYHHIEGQATSLLRGLIDFIDWCDAIRNELSRPRPLANWNDQFRWWLKSGCDDSIETQNLLQPLYESLANLDLEAEIFTDAIPAEVFQSHLERNLAEIGGARGFLSGSITFCELKPMRAIPAKVIGLLGINHDSFPRGDQEFQFDLTRNRRQPGDRSGRDDDNYLFLEAILSARQSLFISYVGQSMKDNSTRPPSTCLQALFEFAPDLREKFHHREALHSFDPKYFNAHSPLSHDSTLLAAAKASLTTNHNTEALLQPGSFNIVVPTDNTNPIPLDTLASRLDQPNRYIIEKIIQARAPRFEDLLAESESINNTPLEQYSLRGLAIESALNSDNLIRSLTEFGKLPPAICGETAFHRMTAMLRQELECPPSIRSAPLTIKLDKLALVGNIPLLSDHDRISNTDRSLYYIFPGGLHGKRLLLPWIHYLATNIDSPVPPPNLCIVGIEKDNLQYINISTELDPSIAKEYLNDLVEVYFEILHLTPPPDLQPRPLTPTPLFSKTSSAYAEAITKNKSHDQALAAAQKEWLPKDFSPAPSDWEDPSVKLFYQADFLADLEPDSPFARLARQVWLPLHKHLGKAK